jgi:hypothetical protein
MKDYNIMIKQTTVGFIAGAALFLLTVSMMGAMDAIMTLGTMFAGGAVGVFVLGFIDLNDLI